MINVVTTTGTKRAVVYIATNKDPVLPPYHWYKEFVVRGAEDHGLPDDYVERIRRERGYAVNPWDTFPRFLVSQRLLIDESYAAPLRVCSPSSVA